jgi:hypothetical protein
MPMQYGGSFAPPLDAKKLAAYRKLAKAEGGAVGDAMTALCDMAETFQKTPASKREGKPHPSGRGMIVRLEDAEVERIDPVVPWPHECEMYAKLFDGIDPQARKELRDAAHHLLWFAVELTNDREPLTSDRL